MKQKSINRKFSITAAIVSIVIVTIGYFILSYFKSQLQEETYHNIHDHLITYSNEQIANKKDIGITNALSIANNGILQDALRSNNRSLAIEALGTLSQTLKENTAFKNVKIHIHTKDNKSFLRNWKTNKFGDDLSSFRKSVVQVNSMLKPVNTFEAGKAGLSIRSVVPIVQGDTHLGSLEFIQGINSVAKVFDRAQDSFVLLMDEKYAVANVDSKFKLQNYIISQKFINEDYLNNLKKHTINDLVKKSYSLDENYFYVPLEIKDFNGKTLGYAISASPISKVEHAIQKASKLIFVALILLIAAIFINLLASIFNLKTLVIAPINELRHSIDTIKNSNTGSSNKIQAKENDEIGAVVNSFNEYLDSIDAGIQQDLLVIDDAKNVITKAKAGLLNTQIHAKGYSNGVILLANEINNLVTSTRDNLGALSDVLVEFSNAKFDKNIQPIDGLTGEIASILSAARNTGTTMSGVLAVVDNASKSLLHSVDELQKASSDLSNASTTQASALEETAAAITETVENIKSSSHNATQMAQLAKQLNVSSISGSNLAKKTSNSMDEISKEVGAINEAITIIDQIAFQTNILSLNAAVEAATAGEAGKGFAVVAGEVRNLASRSAEAAKDIKDIVESAITKANEGKTISTQMIEGYNALNENIEQTTALINQVATSAKEQEIAMVQINDTVNELDSMTQRNANIAANISEMANDTSILTKNLENAVKRTEYNHESQKAICDTDLMFDFTKLKADHINFKNINFAKCADGTRFTVTDHHSCNLGKWITANENNPLVSGSPYWGQLKEAHRNVHMSTQDTVDLYADKYDNGQIFATTDAVEKNIDRVFNYLDKILEYKCEYQKKNQ